MVKPNRDTLAAEGVTSYRGLDDDIDPFIGLQVGNYVIERPLGQGGMATVFAARHPTLGREVAIKFLGPELRNNPQLHDRFLQEARVTASLRHPNIVDIFDFGELEGRFYYVMELLHGEDLSLAMQRRGRFPYQEVIAYVEQICAALDAAHAVGVVHRDLKPANIIVLNGEPLRIKLVDFGVAKVGTSSNSSTRFGQILGTPTHMAPEQAMGALERVSARSDVYALGVIAYEMLSGCLPFQSESEVMLMMMHIREAVPPIASVAPEVPQRIAQLVEWCLAKDPDERPPSARVLAAHLAVAAKIAAGVAVPARELDATSEGPLEARTAHGASQTGSVASPERAQEPTAPPAPRAATPQPVVLPRTTTPQPFAAPPRATTPQPFAPPRTTTPQPFAAPPRATTPQPFAPPRTTTPQPFAAPLAQPRTERSGPNVEPVALARTHLARDTNSVETSLLRGDLTPKRSSSASPEVLPEAADEAATLETWLRHAGQPAATPTQLKSGVRPPLPLADLEPPALFSEALAAPMEADQLVELSTPDQNILEKLLRRMQRHGDFPAFLNNVGEISLKADANSKYSARQLGESILKDFALTAKLLRVVNTTYVNRFGGKVFSVQHAVVILGFDNVRSLVLGVSVFSKPSDKKSPAKKDANKEASSANNERIADSAINSLVSGEIARSLANLAGVEDAELAMMCAMFRNLGHHLVLQYLPEEYARIQEVMQAHNLPMHAACDRVLTTSFQKLGLGIAERWRLPRALLHVMAAGPSRGERIVREEDRLSALAQLSTDLCEIVATGNPQTWQRSIEKLLGQHQNLLSLDSVKVTNLIETVRTSFGERYAALFGPYNKKSRFLRNAGTLSGADANADQDTAPELSEPALLAFAARVTELGEALGRGRSGEALRNEALRLCAEVLGLKRLLVLGEGHDRRSLRVRAALGTDADLLMQELTLPLSRSGDVFSVAFHGDKDVIVDNAFSESSTKRVPQRYYETLGSPVLAIYPCSNRGFPSVLLVADTDTVEKLPSAERLAACQSLRKLLPAIIARS